MVLLEDGALEFFKVVASHRDISCGKRNVSESHRYFIHASFEYVDERTPFQRNVPSVVVSPAER